MSAIKDAGLSLPKPPTTTAASTSGSDSDSTDSSTASSSTTDTTTESISDLIAEYENGTISESELRAKLMEGISDFYDESGAASSSITSGSLFSIDA